MTDEPPQVIVCNGATLSKEIADQSNSGPLRLEYENEVDGGQPNVRVWLNRFIRNVNHLPIRIRDLLEIAAYVFCADRLISRGKKDLVEYHSWSRRLHFVIKVRDEGFWRDAETKRALTEALAFMSGDAEYQFTFVPGRQTSITNLFDREEFLVAPNHESRVALFSGGLDSLAGIVDELKNTDAHLYLVSHRSLQPSTSRTQDQLVQALQEHFPSDRIRHYKFYCSLQGKGVRAREESQRTRAFLYTSIAYALATTLRQREFSVYENGVTAFNFPKREDMGNARSSRTTHPRTIHLLEKFFSRVADSEITINTPFLWKTKADILQSLDDNKASKFISSAVSCSKTFRNQEQTTHCGECSQCVDRRLSAFSVGADDFDHAGLYTFDFVSGALKGETKTLYLDYIRWARYFALCSLDNFYQRMINELAYVYDCVGLPEDAASARIYDLHHRHGKQIARALNRLIEMHYDPFEELPADSFLKLIFKEEHLREPTYRLVQEICETLDHTIPIMFQRNKPKNENDFNDKVQAILGRERDVYEREYPSVAFALARAIPDHSLDDKNLLIESKYLRNSTTPSVASEGIAADLTKYPADSYLLFVVYDPYRSITDDLKFRREIEQKRPQKCRVLIVR